VGLLDAIDRYDPGRNTRFSTYAVWWVFHRMTRALTDYGRLVRIPSHIQAAFHRVRKKRAELRERSGREPTMAEAASRMGIDPAKIAEAETLMNASVVSAEASASGQQLLERGAAFERPEPNPAAIVDAHRSVEQLRVEVEQLPPRERDVIQRRFGLEEGEPSTLREIAEDYGLSGERIRQIQSTGLRRLRKRLQEAPIAA
jgi:RNA polymerase primary sigma factor